LLSKTGDLATWPPDFGIGSLASFSYFAQRENATIAMWIIAMATSSLGLRPSPQTSHERLPSSSKHCWCRGCRMRLAHDPRRAAAILAAAIS